MWDRFADWFNGLALAENTILLGFATVIGVGGGLGVVAFYRLIDLAYWILYLTPAVYLTQQGIPVERRRVHLDEPIKTLGETSVEIRLHADVAAQLKVNVVRE